VIHTTLAGFVLIGHYQPAFKVMMGFLLRVRMRNYPEREICMAIPSVRLYVTLVLRLIEILSPSGSSTILAFLEVNSLPKFGTDHH